MCHDTGFKISINLGMFTLLNNILQKTFHHRPYPFYIKGRTDVIFIHITKTAGTSITKALNCYEPEINKIEKHYTVPEIINIIGEKEFNSAFKFCFVRNPWGRLYSLYQFRRKRSKVYKERYEKYDDFNEWILEYVKTKEFKNDNNLRRNQLDWISDPKNEIRVDFIGRFENLENDFKELCRKIKVPEKHLPRQTVTGNPEDYRLVYNDETKELVRNLFARDIEYFGYEF